MFGSRDKLSFSLKLTADTVLACVYIIKDVNFLVLAVKTLVYLITKNMAKLGRKQ